VAEHLPSTCKAWVQSPVLHKKRLFKNSKYSLTCEYGVLGYQNIVGEYKDTDKADVGFKAIGLIIP
jgi:hypothetical protein